jgi:WD40 repeat protein
VLGLDSNNENNMLVTGDTKGFVYQWDIGYLSQLEATRNEFVPPKAVKIWRAHDNTIVSVKHISSNVALYTLIVTASTDHCCRLWSLDGSYVGSFGQDKKWNLNDRASFQCSNDENFFTQILNPNSSNENVKYVA